MLAWDTAAQPYAPPNRVAGLLHSMPCSCMLETTSHRLLGETSYPLC